MSRIIISVRNQTLRMVPGNTAIVSGSQDFVRFHFELDVDWMELTSFAQFTQNDNSYNVYLDENQDVYMPSEIEAGACTLMLYGTGRKADRPAIMGTTNYLTFTIDENFLIEDASSTEITEPLYVQLLEQVNRAINVKINEYPVLPSSPKVGDRFQVERSKTSYQIDYDALAEAILKRSYANLPNANSVSTSDMVAVDINGTKHKATIQTVSDEVWNFDNMPSADSASISDLVAVDIDGTKYKASLQTISDAIDHSDEYSAYGEVGPLPIVSITDALPLDAAKVIVNIKPVQEGSGDPSPDNVRPITGWTSAKVTKRSDKNLLPTKLYKTDSVRFGEQLIFTEAPQQLTDEGNGVYSITTTEEQEKYLMLAPIGEASHLFFKVKLESTGEKSHILCLLDDSYVVVNTYTMSMSTGGVPSNWTHYFDLTDRPTAKYFVYQFSNSSTAGAKLTITKPQLEVGSAATDYEPHSGYSYDISFSSRTIYGGTIDVLNGKLTRGMSLVDLGTLDWKYDQAMGAFYSDSSYRAYVKSDEGAICSNYSKLENPTEESIGNSNNIIVINKSQFGDRYIERIVKGAIIIKDTRYTDVNTFKAAMSGVQVVYKTTNPVSYDLSGPMRIALLRGENTLWADCGDTTVGYWRDDSLSINKAISERVPDITPLQSGIAIIVDGDNASMSVPVGKFAYIKNNTHGLSDGLYRNTGVGSFPVSGGVANRLQFTAVNKGGLNALVDIVYPVGSIYMSTSSTSPELLFGGTWEQIKDKFLLSAGDSYNSGDTGGEATHTLTTTEVPAHTHARGSMNIKGVVGPIDDASNNTISGAFYNAGAVGYDATSNNTSGGGWKLGFDASRSGAWTGNTSSVGGDGAHNNMPPYLAVNVWKRTA